MASRSAISTTSTISPKLTGWRWSALMPAVGLVALLLGGLGGAVYHIGSGRGTSAREFAEMVRGAMQVAGEIEFEAAQTRDQHVPALVSNPSLAMRVLGWQPCEDLKVRIRDAVKWWLARPIDHGEDAV